MSRKSEDMQKIRKRFRSREVMSDQVQIFSESHGVSLSEQLRPDLELEVLPNSDNQFEGILQAYQVCLSAQADQC